VLGVLPGTVGLIQATEVVKLILGTGDPLVGRLLLFDALGMKFRELKLRRDEDCPVCGKNPTVTELIDYEEFCGIMPEATADELGIPEISVVDFKQRIDRGDDLFVLDVREPEEYELVRLPDTILMPMGELPRRASELDSSREIVVYCRTGRRSAKAIEFLQGLGFRKLYNLQGGINAYAREIDTSLPQY
jgi:rhodanese-related sulfurtransferase